ncbi:unnamed protein product [Sympodiomycopsis kandeliae]
MHSFLALWAAALAFIILTSTPAQGRISWLSLESMKSTTRYENAKAYSDPQSRPAFAYPGTFKLSKGDLFAWRSKTPHNQADTESVVIVTHGVDDNANDYFTYINTAWKAAENAGMQRAPANTLRVAPLFYDADSFDSDSRNSTTLAWDANKLWCLSEGTAYPEGSDFSPLSVFDELIAHFSDRSQFPKVKYITLVGHGCGAIITQRHAAIGKGAGSGISLRYVIGNPSSMVYFTKDRPSDFNQNSCSTYNDWHFGFDDFYIPYTLRGSPASLFKSYAAKDVRYLVSLDDVNPNNGDQSCEARALGGSARKDRTLAYWKYIHLLAGGDASQYNAFPGNFKSISSNNANFKGASVNHQLFQFSKVGHDAQAVLQSAKAQRAIFAA